MKKMNLRSYRKLEQAINDHIVRTMKDPKCTISMYDDNANYTYTQLKNQFEENLKLVETLQLIRNKIRRNVQRTNELNGINDLISERTLVMNKIQILVRLISCASINTIKPPVTGVKEFMKAKQERFNSSESHGFVSEMFEIGYYDNNTLEELLSLQKKYQKQLRQIDDEILEKNMKSDYIFLDNEHWPILTKLDLV